MIRSKAKAYVAVLIIGLAAQNVSLAASKELKARPTKKTTVKTSSSQNFKPDDLFNHSSDWYANTSELNGLCKHDGSKNSRKHHAVILRHRPTGAIIAIKNDRAAECSGPAKNMFVDSCASQKDGSIAIRRWNEVSAPLVYVALRKN